MISRTLAQITTTALCGALFLSLTARAGEGQNRDAGKVYILTQNRSLLNFAQFGTNVQPVEGSNKSLFSESIKASFVSDSIEISSGSKPGYTLFVAPGLEMRITGKYLNSAQVDTMSKSSIMNSFMVPIFRSGFSWNALNSQSLKMGMATEISHYTPMNTDPTNFLGYGIKPSRSYCSTGFMREALTNSNEIKIGLKAGYCNLSRGLTTTTSRLNDIGMRLGFSYQPSKINSFGY